MGDGFQGLDATIFIEAFGTAVTNTITLFAGLLPLGLTVFAATWGVRKAMQFFKGTTAS